MPNHLKFPKCTKLPQTHFFYHDNLHSFSFLRKLLFIVTSSRSAFLDHSDASYWSLLHVFKTLVSTLSLISCTVTSVYFSPPLACQELVGSNHNLSQHITPYLVQKRCSEKLVEWMNDDWMNKQRNQTSITVCSIWLTCSLSLYLNV